MPHLLLHVVLTALTVGPTPAVAGPTTTEPQAVAPAGDSSAPTVDDLGPTVPGFVFVQEATGIPGRTESRAATQELLMTEKRLALIDHRSGQRFLMRLDEDPAGFYEISGDLKEYTRGKDYAKIQNQRDEAERELIRRRSDMSEAEWASTAKANHLRVDAPPGKRETELTISPAPELELGEKKFDVERVVVTENGRVVVDALVTRDIDVKIPFFEFYRRLGAFSSEVLNELAKLDGVPIRAKFTVVTSTFAHPIEVVVRRLGHAEIPEFELALPDGATEVEE
ncbi:MAG: hypothetical protein AAF488_07875, partial [Planctomycetota bacterium]